MKMLLSKAVKRGTGQRPGEIVGWRPDVRPAFQLRVYIRSVAALASRVIRTAAARMACALIMAAGINLFLKRPGYGNGYRRDARPAEKAVNVAETKSLPKTISSLSRRAAVALQARDRDNWAGRLAATSSSVAA